MNSNNYTIDKKPDLANRVLNWDAGTNNSRSHSFDVPKLDESGISDNSEWIVFGNYDNEQKANDDDATSDGILSTRISSVNWSPKKSIKYESYVISDFDYSENENENQSETEEQDVEVTDDECINEEDDNDSLIFDIRNKILLLEKSKLSDIKDKQHLDLINKINRWKNDIKTGYIDLNDLKNNIKKEILYQNNNNLNSFNKKIQEREIRKLRNIFKTLYTVLKTEQAKKRALICANKNSNSNVKECMNNDDIFVKHEGIFMNNPDLDSCIPGYWKKMMLDNLIQHRPSIDTLVLRDDIKHRNFWEGEESGSLQSLSTGWEIY